MTITEATRQYWLNVALDWAESRLAPPQYDECKIALTTPAPSIVMECDRLRDENSRLTGILESLQTLRARAVPQRGGTTARAGDSTVDGFTSDGWFA